jgi:hypothetical protein
LGAIDALLPELSHWSIDHLSANIPPHVNSPGRVIVNLGGLRVTDAIRDRVLRVARDQESEAVRAIRASERATERPTINGTSLWRPAGELSHPIQMPPSFSTVTPFRWTPLSTPTTIGAISIR